MGGAQTEESVTAPIFKYESDLLGCFKDYAVRKGSMFYPEHPDKWDCVLVASDGTQVGVHAKSIPNGEVIAQVVTGMSKPRAPAHAAVVVPAASEWFLKICAALKIGVLVPNLNRSNLEDDEVEFDELLPIRQRSSDFKGNCWLPNHVPSNPAGVPSPKVLSAHREKELRLCGILRRRKGYVTSKDIKAVGLSMATWRDPWLYRSHGIYYPVVGRVLPDEDPDFQSVAAKYAEESAHIGPKRMKVS